MDGVNQISIMRDDKLERKFRIACIQCLQQTNHKALSSVSQAWEADNYDVQGNTDYFILQCLGCEVITFYRVSSNSEDYDPETNEYYEAASSFPEFNIQYPSINLPTSTPYSVYAAYNESYSALKAGLTVLAAAGTRIILELICKEENSQGEKLHSKINSLQKNGTISEAIADTVHGIRFLGNDAVHSNLVKKDELLAAWQTINILISYVYGNRDTQQTLLKEERMKKLNDYKKQIQK